MGEFVGGRIVPKHCGAWNKNSKYEMLSIVYQPETGDSYISRKSVPAGTALNSEEYWAICSEYSAQVRKLEQDVDADVEQMHTDLAQTKADMSKEFSETHVAMSKELTDTHTAISQELTETESRMQESLQQTTETLSGKVEQAQTDLNTGRKELNDAKTTLNKRMDSIAGGMTADSEILDARVDNQGTTHASLGEAMRSAEKTRGLWDDWLTTIVSQLLDEATGRETKAFRAKIAQHPGWMLVDVYADEGISGTSVKKRKEFLRMMEDCEAGKVDYIMAKSISRFARNTVECLSYVRHLQSIGVQLYFEKEGLDTATSVSELILTVMAAFAQEESRSISENLKWGIRKRFESGESRWTKTYGYRKTKDGEIVIEPDEAAIVRMIFKMYQYGIPMTDILDELTFIQAPSARGKQTWNKTALKYLLENEKYIGDMRLQKWVSVDHISHRSVRNDSTVIPVYNVRNHHVPIIDRHTYQQVQRIMELKSPHGEYSRYPYFDTNIVCPLCGKKMIPRVMKVNSHKRILGCFDVDGCRGYAVKGYLVDAALLEAYNTLEIKEKKRTVAMQRMLEIKAESPKLDTVQYYWLDDLVGHIEFKQDTMRVFWKCGLESEVALNASKVEEPTHVAELYRNSLDRAQRSENKPVSVVRADKKSVNTREAQRNVAMQTAKNLRAKENGVAANDY